MQEAWRLEEAEGDAMRVAGVVYNEMKGARSSPDSVVSEWLSRSLLPDTPYRHDSGGDPAHIPELTLEAARAFHAAWYHPSNCRIFLYGDIPLLDILSFLETSFLSSFTRTEVNSAVPLQAPWAAPRRLEKTFPVKPGTPDEARSSVTVCWLLPAVTDPVELVTHEVISEVLVESAGSPLRKELVDSGLGEDLSPVSGLETDLRQMIFAAGLRGTEPDREGRIVGLVEDTLSRLASDGLDPALVSAMMDRVEFRHREIRGGGSPYALRLMGRALRGWVHGADPFDSLEFARWFTALKQRLAADPRYLHERLRQGFVTNPHRLTLVVRPDSGQEERDTAAEKARVQAILTAMTPEQRQAALRDAAAFRDYQVAPDDPALLARIPSIGRADILRAAERIPSRASRTSGGVPLTLHNIFTGGIVYVDLAFPTDCLSGELSLFLPLFGRAVCGAGLPGRPYAVVAVDLFRLTGGFSATLDAGGVVGRPRDVAQHMIFRTRFLDHNRADALDLVGRLLAEADFRDTQRLRDILLELRNDMKSALMPSGHQFAMLRAAGMISPSAAQEEQWRGITQLLFLDQLSRNVDRELPRIVETLELIRSMLLGRAALLANATSTPESFPGVSGAVDSLATRLPAGSASRPAGSLAAPPLDESIRGESLVASAPVGYIALAIPGFPYEHQLNGPCAVLGHLLSTGYLWEKVRMEGGAYGAFSYPRNMDGLFLFGSYRDPHITSTVRAFDDGLALLQRGELDDAEIERAVIGTVGREDRPIDPGEKGFVSLQRALHGVTDDARQARRDALLAVDRRSLAEAAGRLREGSGAGFTAVIAGRRALQEAAADLPHLSGRIIDLPE
jgi:hypothetical protein